MSVELQSQIADLTARITALEARLQEIAQLKGIPGPRGGAGDISAAVANAEQAARRVASDTLSQVQSLVREACDQIRSETNKSREHIQSLLDEGLKNAAENHCIQVLRDYHLLDENHAPTHWTNKADVGKS
jgi:BMFP domain-containing protein YqiC